MFGIVMANPKPSSVPRRLQILVVEDAPSIRGRLVSLIGEIPDLQVSGVAGSVAEANALLRTLRPDVALLDLRLPDGSGLEILGALRALKTGVFVVMITAFDTPRVRSSCLNAGADAFLSKNSEIDELADLLRSIASRDRRTGPPRPSRRRTGRSPDAISNPGPLPLRKRALGSFSAGPRPEPRVWATWRPPSSGTPDRSNRWPGHPKPCSIRCAA